MTLSGRLVIVGFLVFGAAIVAAACVTLEAAGLSHTVLVAAIGQGGITAIDDTLPMLLLVGGCYALGGFAGLALFAVGYRRFIRGARTQ